MTNDQIEKMKLESMSILKESLFSFPTCEGKLISILGSKLHDSQHNISKKALYALSKYSNKFPGSLNQVLNIIEN